MGVAISVAALVVSIVCSIRFRKFPLVLFGLGLFWISLAPTISWVVIRYVMDQIRLYLPIAGLSSLLFFGLYKVSEFRLRPWITKMAFATVIVMYAVSSVLQNVRYGFKVAILRDVLAKYPESSETWAMLGTIYDQNGQFEEALEAHSMAASADPANFDYAAYAQMRKAMAEQNVDERRNRLRSIDVSKLSFSTFISIVLAEIDIKDFERAQRHVAMGLRAYPKTSKMHVVAGKMWEAMGEVERAKEAYSEALTLMPASRAPQEGLARMQKLGKNAKP
jgi:tetratricopeptide (TPR) repeat protein